MPDVPNARAARFFVSPDNKLIDRMRGCESLVREFNTDPPENVKVSDVLGWLNKLDEELLAKSQLAIELQNRLDVNAASPQSTESMQRKLENLQARQEQTAALAWHNGAERDEARKALSAANTELANLMGAQRELERLRKVHAAYVAGARSLLGDKANTLEAECDIPEHFNQDAVEIANAARLPACDLAGTLNNMLGIGTKDQAHAQAEFDAELKGKPEAMQAAADMVADAEKLPPVEDQPVDLVLADRRKTLGSVLGLVRRHFDLFSQLHLDLKLHPSAAKHSRKEVFAGASGAMYGMAMMAVRALGRDIQEMMPEDPAERAAKGVAAQAAAVWAAIIGADLGWKPKK